MQKRVEWSFKAGFALLILTIAATPGVSAPYLFPGDGSDEPGFVEPAKKIDAPPPPPANMSSGESLIPYPGPPAVPQSRSEKKNPPSPPVMFVKIKSDKGLLDWASRPNDMSNLLKSMKELIDVNYQFECRSFSEIDINPEKNPIIYRSGHFHFTLSANERDRMRKYLVDGGMAIFNTGMGSKPFFDSAKEELEAIFPEAPLQRLSSDHPIFHSYYDINEVEYRKGVRTKGGYSGNAPIFYGVTIDCRTVAVISRYCMAIGWDALDDDSLMGYSNESAMKLGVNLLSYATAQRAWAKNAVKSMKFVDKEHTKASKVYAAQITYNGEWKTRHAGLSVLLQQFNQRTDVPVAFESIELKLSDPRLFDMPLIYMTGHEDFQLTDGEVANLREYLKNGGLLVVEACCGRRGFNAGFSQEIKRALPESPLAPISPDETLLFNVPNKIESLGVTPALSSQLGNRNAVPPNLMGIKLEGHYAVIYSPYGMAGGWEMSQNPYAHGYDDAGSLSLGENILFYAITQ